MTNQRKEILKFLKVGFIALAVVLGLDYFLVPQVIKLAVKSIDSNYFCYRKSNILVFGDSHTKEFFRPETSQLLAVTNHSGTGHYPAMNYYQYKEYRSEFPAPSYVVLSANFWMFRSKSVLIKFFSLKNKEFRSEYIEELFSDPSIYVRNLKNFNLNIIENANFFSEGVLRFSLRLLSKKNECVPVSDSIFDKFPENRQKSLTEFVEPKNYKVTDYTGEDFSVHEVKNSVERAYFIKFMDLLKKDGVQVLMLETPEFIGSSKSVTGREIFYQEVTDLLVNYPNVKFIRHDSFNLDESNPKNFFDGGWGVTNSHLSYEAMIEVEKQLKKRHLPLPETMSDSH